MVRFAFSLLLLSLLIIGCGKTYIAEYDISLQSVERPADTQIRYGEQVITKIEEEDRLKYSFEDDLIEILWFPTGYNVHFLLKNKMNHSIKIPWDEAAFVDVDGHSYRIAHSGVKYIDINNLQPPSIIVRKTGIIDAIVPINRIKYIPEVGWIEYPILPIRVSTVEHSNPKEYFKSYNGKTYQLLLPLQIENTINEYIFTFQVDNVKTRIMSVDEKKTVSKTQKTYSSKDTLIKSSPIIGGVVVAIGIGMLLRMLE